MCFKSQVFFFNTLLLYWGRLFRGKTFAQQAWGWEFGSPETHVNVGWARWSTWNARHRKQRQSKLVGRIHYFCELWLWVRDPTSQSVEERMMSPNGSLGLPDAAEYLLQQKRACTHTHTIHTCEKWKTRKEIPGCYNPWINATIQWVETIEKDAMVQTNCVQHFLLWKFWKIKICNFSKLIYQND